MPLRERAANTRERRGRGCGWITLNGCQVTGKHPEPRYSTHPACLTFVLTTHLEQLSGTHYFVRAPSYVSASARKTLRAAERAVLLSAPIGRLNFARRPIKFYANSESGMESFERYRYSYKSDECRSPCRAAILWNKLRIIITEHVIFPCYEAFKSTLQRNQKEKQTRKERELKSVF
jgi:hypothetical protein